MWAYVDVYTCMFGYKFLDPDEELPFAFFLFPFHLKFSCVHFQQHTWKESPDERRNCSRIIEFNVRVDEFAYSRYNVTSIWRSHMAFHLPSIAKHRESATSRLFTHSFVHSFRLQLLAFKIKFLLAYFIVNIYIHHHHSIRSTYLLLFLLLLKILLSVFPTSRWKD